MPGRLDDPKSNVKSYSFAGVIKKAEGSDDAASVGGLFGGGSQEMSGEQQMW